MLLLLYLLLVLFLLLLLDCVVVFVNVVGLRVIGGNYRISFLSFVFSACLFSG